VYPLHTFGGILFIFMTVYAFFFNNRNNRFKLIHKGTSKKI